MTIDREWADAIQAYLLAQRAAGKFDTTIRSERERLTHMARRIGVGPWAVTGELLVEWAGGQDWAQETRRGRYNVYRSFWKWAKRTGRCKRNPAKALAKVQAGEPNPQPVPPLVYRKALRKATERERIWLELAHDHGLRRGEIAVLHSDDVFQDLVGYSLLVHGKGGKKRVIPLTPSMTLTLLALPEGWAFPGSIDGHISPRWIGKRITTLLDGPWTIHKLRHSAATAFWTEGDLATAQKLLGHRSPATTMRYVKVPDEMLRTTVNRAREARLPVPA